jgi:peroxiredoxin
LHRAALSLGIAERSGDAQDVAMTPQELQPLKPALDRVSVPLPHPVVQRIDAAVREIKAPGLSVGNTAPDFTLPNQVGRRVSLRERLGTGPVVLVFYRGEWCPFCNLHLRALQAALPQIQACGASLLAVSPQAPDHAVSIAEKTGLAFDVLSDVEQEVIRAYRLQYTTPGDLQDVIRTVFQQDLRTHTADGSWRLPVPATFVIDREGSIRAAHVEPDFRARMEPEAIVAALKEVK